MSSGNSKKIGVYESPKFKKILEGIINEHKEVMTPEKYSATITLIYDLYGNQKPANHVTMGDFYEGVSKAFYGGTVLNRISFGNPDQLDIFEGLERFLDCEGEDDHTKPDGINLKDKLVWESKAWRVGQSCHLFDGQIRRYRKIQQRLPNFRTQFNLFRHVFFGVQSKNFNLTMSELFRELAEKGTKAEIKVPLSVILNLQGKEYGVLNENLAYRFESKVGRGEYGYPSCTMARVPVFQGFLENPESTIEQIGLNPDDYVIKRVMSPKGVIINEEVELMQFPIVEIEDKNHEAWIQWFLKQEEALNGGHGSKKVEKTFSEEEIARIEELEDSVPIKVIEEGTAPEDDVGF